LNQFVKHTPKCKHEISYENDFICLHTSQKQQLVWKAVIETFIDTKLKLQLKPEQRLKPSSAGADCLGSIVKRKYKLARNSMYHNLRKKPKQHQPEQHPKDIIIDNNHHHLLQLKPNLTIPLFATIASYYGYISHVKYLQPMVKNKCLISLVCLYPLSISKVLSFICQKRIQKPINY
jgi:hypothetical protein